MPITFESVGGKRVEVEHEQSRAGAVVAIVAIAALLLVAGALGHAALARRDAASSQAASALARGQISGPIPTQGRLPTTATTPTPMSAVIAPPSASPAPLDRVTLRPTRPSFISLRAGESIETRGISVVFGDVRIDGIPVYDRESSTGVVVVLRRIATIDAPYGATVALDVATLEEAERIAASGKADMLAGGCVAGCQRVDVMHWPDSASP